MCPILSFLWKNRNSCTITFAHIKTIHIFVRESTESKPFIYTRKYMNTTLLLLGIGTQELLFIALIILLLFGGKKIPELMKGLGKGVKNFKDGMNGMDEDLKDTNEKKEEVASNEKKEK